ncbi:hypothetical protein ACOI22_02740 [Glaciecola sp. 2405UD65-10]|uniref:hypothetical protein n=1 Tax=Glaciecola sp. 2405UD65-10 TaxID=3397244 RepID=UPI003B5A2F3D
MARARKVTSGVGNEALNTDLWRLPNVDELSPEHRKIFYNRYNAVKDYISGSTLKHVSERFQIDEKSLVRLVKRCLSFDESGELYGFHGCIPNKRLKNYQRQKGANLPVLSNSGFSGAFTQLLRRYPELEEQIRFLLFKKHKKNHIHQSRVSLEDLHTKFIEQCRKLKLEQSHSYPFNTKSLAKISLNSFVKRILKEEPKAAGNYFGSNYKAKMAVGTGSNRPVFDVLDRVELDAHKINAIFCILVPSPFGNIVPLVVERVWLISTYDVATKVVLGHHVSLRKEINKDDVLRCVANSVKAWSACDAEYLEYGINSGFPSILGDKYTGIKWNELSVDGAMANLSSKVFEKLEMLMGIKPKVLPRKNKDDRPFVERFFGTLEQRGFNKLPNTTGSSFSDSLRDVPEIKACKYYIQLEELYGLMDCLIANYNGTPHSSIGKRTPLEYFKYRVECNEKQISYVNQSVADNLLLETQTATVKGSQKNGIRPYVNFQYSKYTSPLFASNYSLCGKKIIIQFNADDLRTVKVFLPDGSEIGNLTPSPPWHLYPHSIYVKRAIFSLINKKSIVLSPTVNPVETFLKYHEDQLKNKKQITSSYIEARRDLTNAFDEVKSGTNDLHRTQERLRKLELNDGEKSKNTSVKNDLPPKKRAKC